MGQPGLSRGSCPAHRNLPPNFPESALVGARPEMDREREGERESERIESMCLRSTGTTSRHAHMCTACVVVAILAIDHGQDVSHFRRAPQHIIYNFLDFLLHFVILSAHRAEYKHTVNLHMAASSKSSMARSLEDTTIKQQKHTHRRVQTHTHRGTCRGTPNTMIPSHPPKPEKHKVRPNNA